MAVRRVTIGCRTDGLAVKTSWNQVQVERQETELAKIDEPINDTLEHMHIKINH